jgi:hypothetical protein
VALLGTVRIAVTNAYMCYISKHKLTSTDIPFCEYKLKLVRRSVMALRQKPSEAGGAAAVACQRCSYSPLAVPSPTDSISSKGSIKGSCDRGSISTGFEDPSVH